MPPRKLDLVAAGAAIPKPWSPVVAGDVNESQVKLARLEGAFEWHSHAAEDEGFLVLRGRIAIAFRDGDVELGAGEFLVVPRGVEHCPRSLTDDNVVLMFEPNTTINTGGNVSARTVRNLEHI
jgi:mannose-6-phosphate isomerase-like protein (cupin superfamily)